MNVNEETLDKLRQSYVDESNAYITKVRSILLDLEHNPSQDKTSCLDEIYRLTHSLKSSSNTANFLEIASIAFQLEGYLSLLKKGEEIFNADAISNIFGYVENIEIFVNYFFNNHDEPLTIVDEEFHISEEMRQIYIVESEEHINNSNKLLFALEDETLAPYDAIEEIYREIHSIKGDSNALGFEEAAVKAHEMETFMSNIQNNPEQFNKQTIEQMFNYVDLIKKLIDKHLGFDIQDDLEMNTEPDDNEETEQMEISDEIKELYSVEVVEHINNINNILFDLEAEKSDLKTSLEEIYREIHSIKGDSNALGFSKVGKAAHIMETFMSNIQNNPEQYNKKTLEQMFSYSESIKNIVDNFLNPQSDISVPEVSSEPIQIVGFFAEEEFEYNEESETIEVTEEIKELYSVEVVEHINNINNILFDIEAEKSELKTSLEEIYREIHSIKGDSNALGFSKVGKAAHTMESFMTNIQNNPEQYNKQTLEQMFSYSESIKNIVDKILNPKANLVSENIKIEPDDESDSMEVADEIKELYSVEVVEHINNINNILFDLESEKAELRTSLEEIYREVHSIKGDSNALGFTKVGTSAHTMETFMSNLQKNPEQYNKQALEQMFNYVESIKQIVDKILNSKANIEVPEVTSEPRHTNSFVEESNDDETESMEISDEIKEIYSVEVVEHINNINNILFDLEAEKAELKTSLEEIYREVHSIKGDSNALGFTKVGTAAHTMETFMSNLQKNPEQYNKQTLEQMFNYVESIKNIVDKILNPKANIEVTQLKSGSINRFVEEVDDDESETMEVADEIKEIYSVEVIEHINNINNILFDLESGKSELKTSLEEIYREIHSIKGDSNALGFTKVGKAAHTMETFMSNLQKNPEQYNKQALEQMFNYVESIKNIVDKILNPKVKVISENIKIEPDDESDSMEVADEIKEIYSVEVVEHINNINNILFDLEAEKAELKTSLEEIYREIHSIKGDSNALGFTKVGKAAHTMETFMSNLQNNPEQYNKQTLEQMFNYIASIKHIVDSLNNKKGKDDKKKQEDPKLITQNNILKSFVKNITLNTPLSKLTIMDNKAKLFENEKIPLPQHLKDLAENKISSFDTNNFKSQKDNKKDVAKTPVAKGEKTEDDTIRVSTHKIDKLINLSDELLISKISYEQRLTELKDVLNSLQDYKNKLKNVLKNNSGQQIDSQSLLSISNNFYDNLINLEDKVSYNFKELRKDNNRFSFVVDEIQYDSRNTRMIPASVLIGPLKIVVRNTAKKLNKEIKLSISGEEIEIDRVLSEKLKDPMAHILRNAIDHGLETTEERLAKNKSEKSNISIDLSISGNNIIFKISDDGRGIDYSKIKKKALNMGLITNEQAGYISDYELNQVLLAPGFSTAEKLTDISGRGVGLDVVKSSIEDLNGQITISSVFGKGTSFILTLPVTLTTFDAFLVSIANSTYAIPKSVILSTITMNQDEIMTNGANSAIMVEDKPVKLISLSQILELEEGNQEKDSNELVVLVVEVGNNRLAFSVDQVIETRRMVMKNLGSQLAKVKNVSGATILGNGEPVIVLNMNDIFNASFSEMSNIRIHNSNIAENTAKTLKSAIRVLVVDDSVTTRTLEKNILEHAGFEVIIAKDGIEGKEMTSIHNPDLIITDVEMPKMNGYQFATWVKKESKFSKTPVIMISSLSSAEQKEKAYSTGINSYIVKGEFNQKKLLDTIEELL